MTPESADRHTIQEDSMASDTAAPQTTTEGRVAIRNEDLPYPSFAPPFYSPAIKAGGWLFCSGTMPTDFRSPVDAVGFTDPAALYRPDPWDYDRLAIQSHSALQRLQAVFAAAGADLRTDTIRVEQFFRSPHPTQEDFDTTRDCWAKGIAISPYLDVRNEYIDEARPPSVGFGVTDLPIPGVDLQIDLIGAPGVQKTRFETPEGVASPLAGYSPGIRFGDWVSLAGEVPTDWVGDWMSEKHMGRTGSTDPSTRPNEYLWYGDAMELQVELTLRKQAAIAKAAGASMERCVNAVCYIGHPSDYPSFDKVWKRWFPNNPPARTVIPYAGLGGKGWRFECTMDFLTDDSPLQPEQIQTSAAPEPFGHEPQAVKVGNLVFFSTNRAVDSNGVLAKSAQTPAGFDRYASEGRLQMREILKNLSAIADAAGSSLENLCRLKVFMDDWSAMAPAIDELASAFPVDPPAVSLHRVNGSPVIAPGCRLLVDAIGYAP
jgi:enamine deaminase RidA (YjgF/YER057c/UK114 family)